MTSVSPVSSSTADPYVGRAAPWNNEAEQAVLGAMLLDQDAALRAVQKLIVSRDRLVELTQPVVLVTGLDVVRTSDVGRTAIQAVGRALGVSPLLEAAVGVVRRRCPSQRERIGDL